MRGLQTYKGELSEDDDVDSDNDVGFFSRA